MTGDTCELSKDFIDHWLEDNGSDPDDVYFFIEPDKRNDGYGVRLAIYDSGKEFGEEWSYEYEDISRQINEAERHENMVKLEYPDIEVVSFGFKDKGKELGPRDQHPDSSGEKSHGRW